MKTGNHFQSSQLEAIHKFYRLLKRGGENITMTEAIITWFADGHAEKFREEYLRKQVAVMH
jgi:hypothetical protein